MLTRFSVQAFFVLLGFGFAAVANADFVAGNLVVYRVGAGSALTNASTAVFIDEYLTAGLQVAPVQSVAMPTVAGGGNNPLTAEGTDVTEGLLTRSVDGHSSCSLDTQWRLGRRMSTIPIQAAVVQFLASWVWFRQTKQSIPRRLPPSSTVWRSDRRRMIRR